MTQSTNQKFDLAAAMKGAQWERCKGELRALVAMQGSYHSAGMPGAPESHEMERLRLSGLAVENFIVDFSDNGYGE